jgi:hypothetical protein
MEEAVSLLGTAYTDAQVNQLAQRQFENTQVRLRKVIKFMQGSSVH